MAQLTRKTVMAVKVETTSGTPISPTAGTDFIAVQDGFELTPSITTIDNEELSPSVGSKAPILGIEEPSASISHYIRHSGVEATAPNFDPLIEAAIGAKVAATAERVTDAGSTAGTSSAAATVVLTAGGSDFERGKAVLIKDPLRAHSIRNVHSVSTNTLTLGFNLAAAPAAGVSTGRAILYKPADALDSLSLWNYRGNGGAIELLAGGRVSEMSIEANTGELLNGSFTIDGTAYYFNPVEITASDTKLDFNETGPTLRAATIPAGFYKDPHEMAETIQNAMNDVATDAITVTYSNTTGKYTITSAGTLLELLWNTGANTANTIGDKIGFSTAADDTGALTYTSDNAITLAAGYTPTSDSNVNPLVVKNSEFMIGSFSDYGCSGAQSLTMTLSNTLNNVLDLCEETGIAEKILTQREVSVEVVLTLSSYDAEKFKRFRRGDDVRMAFTGGVKTGGNWTAGRCVNVYMPQAKISEFQLSDSDGIITIEMTLNPYVAADGLGEVYMNFI